MACSLRDMEYLHKMYCRGGYQPPAVFVSKRFRFMENQTYGHTFGRMISAPTASRKNSGLSARCGGLRATRPTKIVFPLNGRPMGAPTGLISQLYNSTPSGVPKQFAKGKLYHICEANISHPSRTDISHFPQENISLSNLSLSDKLLLIYTINCIDKSALY